MKKILIWLGLSILMMIFWIIGIMIGNKLFPSDMMGLSNESQSKSQLMLLLSCGLNAGVVLFYIYNSHIRGWKLAGTVFLVTFGIQYFMSQIESLWFNDSLNMPLNTIFAVVSGGFFSTLLFSVTATWLTGNLGSSEKFVKMRTTIETVPMIKKILLLAFIIWPLIYFLAGYLIAWQFSAIRKFYSGTTVMDSFFSIMKNNFSSGLYFFQIFRGFLWILIVLPALAAIERSRIRKGIIIGLLISFLGSSQLLLPNPVMPETVRMVHLLETASSGFLWGFIIAWYLDMSVIKSPLRSKEIQSEKV
ncbi:MAG: hypothetical protein J7K46_07585 [Bacteroidales bacterium]|nr:hypothetical protein [Bacteroidales bacterium]